MTIHAPAMPPELAAIIAAHREQFAGFRMMADDDQHHEHDEQDDSGEQEQDKGPAEATDEAGNKLGFPVRTPVSKMTDAQQAAYYKHQSRKHENRAKASQAELDRLRRHADPDDDEDDEQGDDDKKQGQKRRGRDNSRRTAEQEADDRAFEKYGRSAVKAEFRAALKGERSREQIDTILEDLNLRSFIDAETGDVDTDKVIQRCDAILSPSNRRRGGSDGREDDDYPDMGQGNRGTGKLSKAEAGRAEARRRFPKSDE